MGANMQDFNSEPSRLKIGLAQMLKGGVIMDVVTPDQAKIAEDAGAIVTSLDNKSFKYGKEDYKNPTILIRRSENLNA